MANVSVKYVVYELNQVMGSERHLALEKTEFKNMVYNSFDTEEEAVKALIEDGKTWDDYLILKQFHITS